MTLSFELLFLERETGTSITKIGNSEGELS